MADKSITVLGGGNTAFGIAANLTLRGYEITLYEVPEFSDTLEPLKGNRGITLNGVAEVGEALAGIGGGRRRQCAIEL